MSCNPVIQILNIGKAYKRYTRKYGRMAEWLGMGTHHDPIWVLQGISFDVAPGQAMGIVGVNGAGKSTLLKIITGTTRPTTGAVQVGGRISALLELGMGFHPEFTGRQNCYVSGQLHGLKAREIEALIPEIIDFAEIGDYFDQVVRTYSSGMQVRLAFALATAVRPEILIVDEALSVGDAYFQHKCIRRIREFQEKGTALLFVSHSPEIVRMICQRAIMLEGGRIIKNADAASVMDYYRASQVRRTEQVAPGDQPALQESRPKIASRDTKIVLLSHTVGDVTVDILTEATPVHSGDNLRLCITVAFNETYPDPHIGFGIRNKMGITIYETNTYTLGYKTRSVSPGDRLSVIFGFQCRLIPDTYEIVIGVADGGYDRGSFEKPLFFDQSFLLFEVVEGNSTGWAGLWNLQPTVEIR